MKWEDRLIQLLGKESLNQKEYDEFVSIGDQLKSEKDIDTYKQYGEGIYLLLEPEVKVEDF